MVEYILFYFMQREVKCVFATWKDDMFWDSAGVHCTFPWAHMFSIFLAGS